MDCHQSAMLWRDKPVEELLDVLDLSQWTAIAYQRADGLDGPRWLMLDGAPLSFDQVDYLVGQGLLIKAQQRIGEQWIMVVRVAAVRP